MLFAVLALACGVTVVHAEAAGDPDLTAIDRRLASGLATTAGPAPELALADAARALQDAQTRHAAADPTAPIRTLIEARRRIILTVADLLSADGPSNPLARGELLVSLTDYLRRTAQLEARTGVSGDLEAVRDGVWTRFAAPMIDAAASSFMVPLAGAEALLLDQWFQGMPDQVVVLELMALPGERTLTWASRRFDQPAPEPADALPVLAAGGGADAALRLRVDLSGLSDSDRNRLTILAEAPPSGVAVAVVDRAAAVATCTAIERERAEIRSAAEAASGAPAAEVADTEADADAPQAEEGGAPEPATDADAPAIATEPPLPPLPAYCDTVELAPGGGQAILADARRGLLIETRPATEIAADVPAFLERLAYLAGRWP